MPRLRSSRFVLIAGAGAASLLLLACQSAERKPSSAEDPANTRNADALLAAGIVRYAETRDPAQAMQPLQRAAEQAPKRPELQWLHVYFCGQTAGCDPAAAETRLRKLDATNGIAWVSALARAQRQRDTAAEAQILEALSRSQKIDTYWTALIWRTALALRDMQPKPAGLDDPLTKAMNTATEQLSVIAIASFRPIVAACSAAQVQRDATAQRCSKIAQVLQRSDTYIAAGVGLGIEERMSAPGSPAAQAVGERIRIARYQQETASQIMESVEDRAALSGELIELMQKLHREQEVFTAVLRWAGQPTTPPPEWQAASEENSR